VCTDRHLLQLQSGGDLPRWVKQEFGSIVRQPRMTGCFPVNAGD
jgi:hypothetical protein